MAKANILIVEDEQIVALDIARSLQRSGYHVLGSVISGKQAIEFIRKSTPDLVLMDIQLQGEMDGVVAAAIISDEFDLPVIYLTANSDSATIERAQITEPYGYLVKPFKESELYAAIQTSLYKHRILTQRNKNSESKSFLSPQTPLHAKNNIERVLNSLRALELFSQVSDEELSAFARQCEVRIIKSSTEFSTVDSCAVFIVLSGRIALIKSEETGKDLIVDLILPYDPFLLILAVENYPVPLKIRAQVDSEIIQIPQMLFILLIEKHREIYRAFLSTVTSRLAESYNFSKSLAHDQVQVRVASALLKLISVDAKENSHINILRREIAELTGTALETVVRELKKLEKEGVLDLSRPRCINILDRETLIKISNKEN